MAKAICLERDEALDVLHRHRISYARAGCLCGWKPLDRIGYEADHREHVADELVTATQEGNQ